MRSIDNTNCNAVYRREPCVYRLHGTPYTGVREVDLRYHSTPVRHATVTRNTMPARQLARYGRRVATRAMPIRQVQTRGEIRDATQERSRERFQMAMDQPIGVAVYQSPL